MNAGARPEPLSPAPPPPSQPTTTSPAGGPTRAATALAWSGGALLVLSWISAALFGSYTLFYYGRTLAGGHPDEWNRVLPRLYDPSELAASFAIGLHFATGAILLLLGPLQFFAAIRRRAPALHRWVGRVYAGAALAVAGGGLGYIALRGCVGGWPMNLGFALYGTLIAVAAFETLRRGRHADKRGHRAWATRLLALVLGSWLYRIDYGLWELFAHSAGHTHAFTGPFDRVMDFFFYLPNLLVAELALRSWLAPARRGLRVAASGVLGATAALLTLATYFFARYEWLPAILGRPG